MRNTTNFEYYSSMFLISFPLFLGVGISNIISTSGYDSWISIILGSILGLFIQLIMKKFNEDNKIFSTIYSFLLLLFSLIILSKLVSSIYLTKTPNYIVMLPLIFVLFFVYKSGVSTLFKSSTILLLIYVLLLFLVVPSLTMDINFDNYLPIYNHSFINIFKSSIDYALISTVPFMVLPEFKERSNYKVYLLSSLVILNIFLLIIGCLGENLAIVYRYPEYMVFKKVSILNFIENVENILFLAWFINSFILSSFAIIKIGDNYKLGGVIISLILVFIFGNFVILNNYKASGFIIDNYTYIILSIFIIYIISKLLKRINSKLN